MLMFDMKAKDKEKEGDQFGEKEEWKMYLEVSMVREYNILEAVPKKFTNTHNKYMQHKY